MAARSKSCSPFIVRLNTVVIFILFLNEATSLLITDPVLEDGQVDIHQTEKPEKPIRMSAWARKAGGNWKPEFVQSMTEAPKETTLEQENDEEDYSYEDSEEPECPDDMFYHVRGKQCVPFKCPGPKGKSRDQKTGECLLQYGGGRDYRYSHPYNPVYRSKFYRPSGGHRSMPMKFKG